MSNDPSTWLVNEFGAEVHEIDPDDNCRTFWLRVSPDIGSRVFLQCRQEGGRFWWSVSDLDVRCQLTREHVRTLCEIFRGKP